METSYELINNVIINTLKKSGEGRTDRLLVAINQCDMVMKGWNLGCGSRPSERRLGKLFGGESVFETYMPSEKRVIVAEKINVEEIERDTSRRKQEER